MRTELAVLLADVRERQRAACLPASDLTCRLVRLEAPIDYATTIEAADEMLRLRTEIETLTEALESATEEISRLQDQLPEETTDV
jgi:hypothetical protein